MKNIEDINLPPNWGKLPELPAGMRLLTAEDWKGFTPEQWDSIMESEGIKERFVRQSAMTEVDSQKDNEETALRVSVRAQVFPLAAPRKPNSAGGHPAKQKGEPL